MRANIVNGTHGSPSSVPHPWIPAYAGMTVMQRSHYCGHPVRSNAMGWPVLGGIAWPDGPTAVRYAAPLMAQHISQQLGPSSAVASLVLPATSTGTLLIAPYLPALLPKHSLPLLAVGAGTCERMFRIPVGPCHSPPLPVIGLSCKTGIKSAWHTRQCGEAPSPGLPGAVQRLSYPPQPLPSCLPCLRRAGCRIWRRR